MATSDFTSDSDIVSICDDLTCTLCHDMFKEPKLLSCYHSFCKTCIEQLISKEAQDNTSYFTCPLCHSTIESRAEFPSNVYIQTQLSFQHDILKCEVCECQKDIKTKCLDCDQLLCDSCLNFHLKIKTCKNHKVVEYTKSVTPSLKIKKSSYCLKHRDEMLRFYCTQCDKTICRDCKHTTHEGHKCEDVQDHFKNSTSWLETYCQSLDFEISCHNNRYNSIVNLQKLVEKNKIKMHQSLNKQEEECCKAVKKSFTDLKTEIEDISNEEINSLLKKKTDLESKIRKITSERKYVDQVVHSEFGSDITQVKSQLSLRQEWNVGYQSRHFRVDIPSLSFPDIIPVLTMETFGVIRQNRTIHVGLTLTLENTFICNVLNKSVSAICITSVDEALVSFKYDTMKQDSPRREVIKYDSTGSEKMVYAIPTRLDLTLDKNGNDIYYYDSRMECITVYPDPGQVIDEENPDKVTKNTIPGPVHKGNNQGKVTKGTNQGPVIKGKNQGQVTKGKRIDQIKKKEVIYSCSRPVSMNTFENGDVIILDVRKKLTRLSLTKEKELKDKGIQFDESILVSPIKVACDQNDLWVADPGSGLVVVYDANGQVKIKFDARTHLKTPNEFRPYGVCTYNSYLNNTFVVDPMNNCVFTISKDGQYCDVILDHRHKLESPTSIACSHSKLWLCDKKNRIRIYNIKNS